MEHFPFMEECLREFNYPKIGTMEAVEIMEIFSKSNRVFLVKWILQQIDDDYGDILENASLEQIAEIINCNGFCNKSEKMMFMTGDLNSEKQFHVFYKMFKHLKDTNIGKLLEFKQFSNEDLEKCVKFNQNLFPLYGPKQTLTQEERLKKLKKYEEEIEELKDLIELSNTNRHTIGESLDPTFLDQMTENLKYLDSNLLKFTGKIFEIAKEDTEAKPTDFGPELGQNLDLCNKSLKELLQLIKSKNTVADFGAKTIEETVSVREAPKQIALVRELAKLCQEINALKKI